MFLAGTSALCIAPASADPLYGLDHPSIGAFDFGQINATSGAFTNITQLPSGLVLPLEVTASNPISGEYYFGASGNTLAVNGSTGAYRSLNSGLTILGFDVSKDLIVASKTDASGNHIVTIDPVTQTQTQLPGTYAPASQFFYAGGTAVNSIGREVYLETSTSLLVVNLDTGALVRSVPLQNMAGMPTWDPISGTLYDFAVPTVSDFRLATINTVTGQVSTISTSNVLSGGIANQVRSLSIVGNVLYVESLNGTFDIVNLATGTLQGTFTSSAIALFPQDQVVLGGNSNTTFPFAVENANAAIIKVGPGTTVLMADSQNGAGTVIMGGTLQLGNGGTSGSVAGNITDNAALVFDRSDNIVFTNVISGTGTVTNLGTGSLTLSGTNTYTGATTVNSGTLNVTGSIASSAVTVQSGATLSGTGKVGATTIANDGTLTPGSSTSPGTLSVTGNLTLASGSNYLDVVTPTVAGLTSVSGAASINGSAIASLASGTYTAGQRYTLINAAGGVSGTFPSLSTSGLPVYLKAQLSYDANNVYLNLVPNLLSPLLSNATGNQRNVVSAIDAAVTAGATPSGGFLALYGLSSAALNSAVDQISGRIGPNVSNSVGQSFLSFLSVTAQGGSGEGGSFAPGSAYGEAGAPHRAQLGTGETRVWGAVYGGHVGLSGDTASGAASLSSNNVGLIGGADMQLAEGLLGGVTLGLGRQLFNSGNGSGNSNDYMLGLYGRANIEQAYIAASLGYGWHQITTLRVVTVSGTDVLQGKENADDFGGRIEAGWRMALGDGYSTAPYAAFAGESFESPAYAETALSGTSTFALSYASHSSALGRSELGAHLDHDYGLDNGVLTADARAAWAHQLDDLPFTQASFQNLPGAAFQVVGVRPDRDTALLGLDLQVQNSSGLFFGVKGEGQFGAGTTLLEGMGNFGWRW